MSYNVFLHPKAANSLKKLDRKTGDRVKGKLRELGKNPKLGIQLAIRRYWKLRIEDYRAIYEINKSGKYVTILFIGHRSKVYDDFKRVLLFIAAFA